MGLLGFFLFAGLIALGVWQLQRLAWKEALIDRVNQRVHAPALPPPTPAQWPRLSVAEHEYRHVHLSGTFLPQYTSLTQANTRMGPGFWVMTPLRDEQGQLTWINRGFVSERQTPIKTPSGEVRLNGLLRWSEPHGSWLRPNQAASGQWYSRDVAALSQAHGLTAVAPYFVDADADPATPFEPQAGQPLGGLTVISFANHHLSYALTWFALALGVVLAAWQFRRLNRLENAPLSPPDDDPANTPAPP